MWTIYGPDMEFSSSHGLTPGRRGPIRICTGFPAFCRWTGGHPGRFSGNSPKRHGERSDGAFATQAGVESESTATLRRTGEKFDDAEKLIQCRQHAPFQISWSTKMPSNRSLVAAQQSGGEFSEMRIASSTI
ncbi:MAG: hypothetical protein H7839_06785 [Magnetococcus sp. YQC-5]